MERELEVKILNMEIGQLEERVKALDGKLIGREIQVNTLLDSPDKLLEKQHKSYMRIREVKDILNNKEIIKLTLKTSISNYGIRDNIETSTLISDKEATLKILNTLGYFVYQEGRKVRTSYSLENARIDFDVWDKETYPYPYAEIEVKSEEDLGKIIEILEIPKENISLKSILELRRELNLE